MLGFHAQQAAEKLLKAALFLMGAAPPRTHSLAELAQLVADHGHSLPPECEELRWLTPYAVLYRYDDEPGVAEEALEREAARKRICQLRAWVEQLLAEHERRQQN